MTVVATDDFNRANGAIGANWAVHGGYTTPVITSNAIASTAATDCAATYTAANAGSDDMYTRVDSIVSTSNNHNDNIVWCRMPNDGTETGYMADSPVYTGLGDGSWSLQRASSGTFTSLGGNFTALTGASKSLEVRAVGTTISIYLAGVLTLAVTDSTHSGSLKRFGGIHVYADSTGFCSIDNFEMGNFAAAAGPVASEYAYQKARKRAANR